MQDDRFEWNDIKARANLEKHEVSFEVARLVFDDPAGIDEIDDRVSTAKIASQSQAHYLCEEGNTP